MQRDMRLHREVVLTRQVELMPVALAGDSAAQKEIVGLSELARSFTATMRDAFGSVFTRQIEDRRRRAAELSGRAPVVPQAGRADWVWVLNERSVFVWGHTN